MRIYDCSNSIERPYHRGGGGPKDNDIIRYLKENAHKHGVQFVDELKQANIALTNDVFPQNVASSSIPKIKRMDGTFFTHDLKDRNQTLNDAATSADHVIFISEFSRQSSFQLYNLPIRSHSVILNVADTHQFSPHRIWNKKCKTLVTSATAWTRPEKRLEATLKIAELAPEWTLFLIGTPDLKKWTMPNVHLLGYMYHPSQMASLMRACDAMISMSYKDPCPKTVCQGVACGLPILYADSGGHREIVQSGIAVPDKKAIEIEPSVPNLSEENLLEAICKFDDNFKQLAEHARQYNPKKFEYMIVEYFETMRKYC